MRLKTKNNIKLTIQEQKILYETCKEVNFKLPSEITVIKNTGLSSKKGNGMACFSMLHPNTIFICADSDDWEMIVEKIGHEYIHWRDFHTFKFFKYAFMAQLGIRNRYLEPQAYAFEKSLNYSLSFWVKNPASGMDVSVNSISQAGNMSKQPATNLGWELWTLPIAGNNMGTIDIHGSQGNIDDIRLIPTNAQAYTMTYDTKDRLTSYADANDVIYHYNYDAFERLTEVRDMQNMIISTQSRHEARE